MRASKTVVGIIIMGSLALTGCQSSTSVTDPKPTEQTQVTPEAQKPIETEAPAPEARKQATWEDLNGEWVSTDTTRDVTVTIDLAGISQQTTQGRATDLTLSFTAMQDECFGGTASTLEADGSPSPYGGYAVIYCPADVPPPAGEDFARFPGDVTQDRLWMGVQIGYPFHRQ